MTKRTLNNWLDEYLLILNSKKLKKHTIDNKKSLIKVLRHKLGKKNIKKIKTLKLAEIVNDYVKQGKDSAAKSMHQLLKCVFREAYFNGWVEQDPTIPLRCPTAPVKRCRLTFDEYKKILNYAKKSEPQYLYQALILAIITGQRRSDIVTFKRSDIIKGHLYIEQYKTGAKIALPLSLYCTELDMTLNYAVNEICTGKNYLIENNGKQVHVYNLTEYFAKFRDIVFFDCKYWNGNPPTFHEIRSVSERLYRARGIDTMTLLGHKSQRMTDRYNDSRGREWRYLKT